MLKIKNVLYEQFHPNRASSFLEFSPCMALYFCTHCLKVFCGQMENRRKLSDRDGRRHCSLPKCKKMK